MGQRESPVQEVSAPLRLRGLAQWIHRLVEPGVGRLVILARADVHHLLAVVAAVAFLRMGNRGPARNVDVRAFVIDKVSNAPLNKQVAGVSLPTAHDLTIAVPDWQTLDVSVQTVAFE